MNRALVLLALCQGFFLTNNVTFIAINGLVGLALAPEAWMATLPITAYVAGAALFAGLVGRHQRAWGRQRAFQFGLCMAIASTPCAHGPPSTASSGSSSRHPAGRLLQRQRRLYRFAATEIVAPSFKERRYLLGAGRRDHRCGRRAQPGPGLAHWLPVEFAGAYAALAGLALCSLATMSFIRFPPLPVPTVARRGGRCANRGPAVFIVAVVACAFGYGVMNLLMAATPIAMAMCSHPFANTRWCWSGTCSACSCRASSPAT
jgi:hypothetical protein